MNYDMFDEMNYFTNLNENNFQNNNNNMNISPTTLFNPYEGYVKGNLFKNLYETYKNFKPKGISITNERDEMLLNVNQLSFARHELNLLLDVYPNNTEALNLFNRYLEMEKTETKNYERRYGPLTITGEIDTNTPFAWENDKWPWEI
ncbi:MAG: spore coat protein CotJB [Bacilli bacterium]|nr:spore coat protein CotJB [Bacilli bacterium]